MSIQETNLQAIADAIRAKDGTTDPIVATDFATRIAAIPTGVRKVGVGQTHSGDFTEATGLLLVIMYSDMTFATSSLDSAFSEPYVSDRDIAGVLISDADGNETTAVKIDNVQFNNGIMLLGISKNASGAQIGTSLNDDGTQNVVITDDGTAIDCASLTSDANATASDILSGKTAYVNGVKITGTASAGTDTSDATVTAGDIKSGKIAYGGSGKITGTLTSTVVTNGAYVQKDDGAGWQTVVNIAQDCYLDDGDQVKAPIDGATLGDATVANVLSGKTFTSTNGLKLTGTYNPISIVDGVVAISNTDGSSATLISAKGKSNVVMFITAEDTYSSGNIVAAAYIGSSSYTVSVRTTGTVSDAPTCSFNSSTGVMTVDGSSSSNEFVNGQSYYYMAW